jgi:cell division septation protein DedD
MRDFDKIRERVVYPIEARKLARLAGLAVLLIVVAFYVGLRVGRMSTLAEGRSQQPGQSAAVVSGQTPEPAAPAPFTYEQLLTDCAPAAGAAGGPSHRPLPSRIEAPGGDGGAGAYTVQVRAFRSDADANALAKQLRSNGYDAYVAAEGADERGAWYRVRIGRFSSLDAATRYQKEFETREGFSTLVSSL